MIGLCPPLIKSLKDLLLLAGVAGEGLGGAQVVLGLLAQGPGAIPQPLLREANVALLELCDLHAGGKPLLGRLGVLLLEPQELHPAQG